MLMLFLTVALVHIITLVNSGPDLFFVLQTAIGRSRRGAMMDVLGITYGVIVWAGVALPGLSLILARITWLHNTIMVGGGLYLCWMSCQMLRGALKEETVTSAESQMELARSGHSFVKGLLTNLANPKTIIYFGSVFSLFVDDSVGAGARWGIFLLIIVGTLAQFMAVASLFALPGVCRGYQRMAKWIDGIASALFASSGIHLIISR